MAITGLVKTFGFRVTGTYSSFLKFSKVFIPKNQVGLKKPFNILIIRTNVR